MVVAEVETETEVLLLRVLLAADPVALEVVAEAASLAEDTLVFGALLVVGATALSLVGEALPVEGTRLAGTLPPTPLVVIVAVGLVGAVGVSTVMLFASVEADVTDGAALSDDGTGASSAHEKHTPQTAKASNNAAIGQISHRLRFCIGSATCFSSKEVMQYRQKRAFS